MSMKQIKLINKGRKIMEFYAKWPSFGLSIISSIDLQGGGGFPSQIVELELVSL